jgi:colanic acid biosynthesis glycosyl transferase WcaI
LKILVYGINYQPELIGVGKYTGEMTAFLASRGHTVRVITAPPYYPEWKVASEYNCWWYRYAEEGRISVWRCPLYVPGNPRKISRLIHLASFAISSLPVALVSVFWRPDIVIGIEPTLFTSPATLLLARLAKARSVLHIQDYEIDAMIGFGLARRGRLASLVTRLEHRLMRSFDRVTSISRSMLDKARAGGVAETKLGLFPNWVDTGALSPGGDGGRYRKQFGIPPDARVVLHSGNIGNKHGLELMLDAAAYFSGQANIFFLIVGEGAQKAALQGRARVMALENVIFAGLQPRHELRNLLASADIHVVLQKRGGGDAVYPSRLTAILSVGGRALVTASEGTELYKLSRARPGIYKCIEPENKAAFYGAISEMLQSGEVGHNVHARQYALDSLCGDVILGRFEHGLRQLLSKGE